MNKLKALLAKKGAKEVAAAIMKRLAPDHRVVSYDLRANVAKNGLFRPEYSFDVPISSVNVDRHGQRMSESFLADLPNRYSEIYGYYEDSHPEGFNRPNATPDFRMDSLRFDGSKLVGTVHILKESPKYRDVLKSFRDGRPRGVSIELKKALVSSEDTIIDAEEINGFIITTNPANRDTLMRFDLL